MAKNSLGVACIYILLRQNKTISNSRIFRQSFCRRPIVLGNPLANRQTRNLFCMPCLRNEKNDSNGSKNEFDFANDPEMKDLLKELQNDFEAQPKEANKAKEEKQEKEETTSGSRYEKYTDEKSDVVYDMYEEQHRLKYSQQKVDSFYDELEGINLQRGETGVFDLDDLVELLYRENASDVVVLKLREIGQHAEHLAICTTKSSRHTIALATFIRKVYKRKKNKTDPMLPSVEVAAPTLKRLKKLQNKGRTWDQPKDWNVLHLGNIVLHIMSQQCRDHYDIESLWAVGPKYDEKTQEESTDELEELVRRHTFSLQDFKPQLA